VDLPKSLEQPPIAPELAAPKPADPREPEAGQQVPREGTSRLRLSWLRNERKRSRRQRACSFAR
jgi:hypothetical protein